MKKILFIFLALVLIAGAAVAWLVIGPGTGFSENKKILYIRTSAATTSAVMDSINKNEIVNSPTVFRWIASQLDYWENIRPGRYEIQKGTNVLSIVRMLRNGRQSPVNLTITKLRTKEDLARVTGNRFEFDSLQMIRFLNSNDSLKAFGVDTNHAMTLVLPDTYSYLWTSTPDVVLKKLHDEKVKFWTEERKQKASSLGITPEQAYIIASIVEEETNYGPEKPTIASVYLNRVRKGMLLQADPTVKFALKDFGLRRIYHTHTRFPSPYNTYVTKGIPPGPICTPSKNTIEAVLDAPKTEYIFFVASHNFDGSHDFSVTYDEHLKKARLYQQALNRRDSIRKQNQTR
jgi:UPF0755 protein